MVRNREVLQHFLAQYISIAVQNMNVFYIYFRFFKIYLTDVNIYTDNVVSGVHKAAQDLVRLSESLRRCRGAEVEEYNMISWTSYCLKCKCGCISPWLEMWLVINTCKL